MKPNLDDLEKEQAHPKKELQDRLLAWSSANGREFPWRNTRNPYAVLIAEKLLQQTAATPVVVRAFEMLYSRYPDPEALLQADPNVLRGILLPLGFHYRAQELVRLAAALVEDHNGVVPSDLHSLKLLPGVGEYIARAVLTFAYDQDVAIVDTNVARFLFRVYGIDKPLPPNPARSKAIIALATELIPRTKSRDFNFAVLDLCSKICVPREPKCTNCPIQIYCLYGLRKLGPTAENINSLGNGEPHRLT